MLKLPDNWELFLDDVIDFTLFYKNLDMFLNNFKKPIIPFPKNIFRLFELVPPENVKCVLFGEDPYPRITSANGVAFWDNEIKHWSDKTNGNSLKNILKALLTYRALSDYSKPISECRTIAEQTHFLQPDELFKKWLNEGVFLLNTSLTFTIKQDKNLHFQFWEPFLHTVINKLVKTNSPYFILWGNKAKKWASNISEKDKIIEQGHPTFLHQFMNKNDLTYSPFTEIIEKTKLSWI